MALFRERRRLSPLVLIGGGLLLVVLVSVAGLILRSTAVPADPLVAARAQALAASQGLELVTIEYPKVLRNEPSGALGALQRAEASFAAARGDLARINGPAVNQIAAAFATLDTKVAARAPSDEVTALADTMREQLAALSKP